MVYVSRMTLAQNPHAAECLRHSPESDWESDARLNGYWVRVGSPTYTLVQLFGLDVYDHRNWPEIGTFNRNGRVR